MDVQWTTNGRHKLSKVKLSKVNTLSTSLSLSEKPKNRYSTIASLTEEVFLEIAAQYNVSPAFVRLEFEKMKNWLEAKGKTYKNYKAGLRGFVLRDIEKSAERRSDATSKVSIDTSQL